MSVMLSEGAIDAIIGSCAVAAAAAAAPLKQA